MRVIGTAGHVDHGKSTLVKALTGIHPDRLKEEQDREMTIDLGFAWMTLPSGEDVGIVDVPGHRDFIENMLAGVGGIDAVLFVIAADEGVMPQTREHLAILDLLAIKGGVIVLSKIDSVTDLEWIDLVKDEIHEVVRGTVLENAPILPVSSKSGTGIDALISALDEFLLVQPKRLDIGKPRLPVDRVFTISGFGTVVTGTLSDGQFRVGDDIVIMPRDVRGRIRGLQSHKQKSEVVSPGSRTAVNISGVNVDNIKRGDVICHPGDYHSTKRIDVSFQLLHDATYVMHHNDEAKFFIGATEVIARIRLLGVDELLPGEHAWLQLEFREPVVCVRGDRYILRRPSPPETIGGGVVIDPHPKGRYKRRSEKSLMRFEALALGDPADIFEQALITSGISSIKDAFLRSNLEIDAAQIGLDTLINEGRIVLLEPGREKISPLDENFICSSAYWEQLGNRVMDLLGKFHKDFPLRRGMPREELKSRLRLNTRPYNLIIKKIIDENLVSESHGLLKLPVHQVIFSDEQQKKVERLMKLFQISPNSPPSVKESQSVVGEDVYQALVDLGEFVQLSTDVVYTKNEYERIREIIVASLIKDHSITVAQVRDQFSTSRKYALAILEHLDTIGVTVREGDFRQLKEQ